MIKTLFKYLLSLWILLLCVCSQLFAHTYQEAAFHAPAKVHEWPAYATYGNSLQEQTFISKPDSDNSDKHTPKKEAGETCEDEVEETESSSSKKRLVSSNYFTAIFYTLAQEYFFSYLKTSLPYCKQFSFTSPHRYYLIFQVFRI